MNFFIAQHVTATTVMKFKSRLHYRSFKAQKLLEISEVFWSFTCISKSILCTQSGLTKSEGRNIKLRCYCKSQTSNSGTSNVFSKKKPWLETPMTRNSTVIMPMDIHKQAIEEKKLSPSWIRKTSRKKKSNEKRLETLFTHRRSNIYLHKLPFIVDLTDIKSWIVFKFS